MKITIPLLDQDLPKTAEEMIHMIKSVLRDKLGENTTSHHSFSTLRLGTYFQSLYTSFLMNDVPYSAYATIDELQGVWKRLIVYIHSS